MERTTKVVIGVGIAVVVITIGAVVYFQVIKKPEADLLSAGASDSKPERTNRGAAGVGTRATGSNRTSSAENTASAQAATPLKDSAGSSSRAAKGIMEEEIKPSNIKIADAIHDAIDGVTYSSAAQQKAANAIYAFSVLPDYDFKQVYRYYNKKYNENILGANGIAGELYVSADMLKKLTKRALAIKLNVK